MSCRVRSPPGETTMRRRRAKVRPGSLSLGRGQAWLCGPRSRRRWLFATVSAFLMIAAGSRPAMAQDCASGAAFTGPIRITSGGTYTGNWQSPDRTTPVVQIFTTQPVTIVNSRLRGPNDLLTGGPGTNVTVQESCFVGTFPAPRGTYKGRAIALWRAANVRIEHNDFDSTGGYETRYGLQPPLRRRHNLGSGAPG